MRYFLETVFGLLILFGLPLGVLLAICLFVSSWVCNATWNESGYASKYGIVSGCRVQKDGRWIPEERFRETVD